MWSYFWSFLDTRQQGVYLFYDINTFYVYLAEGTYFCDIFTFDACVSGGVSFFSAEGFLNRFIYTIYPIKELTTNMNLSLHKWIWKAWQLTATNAPPRHRALPLWLLPGAAVPQNPRTSHEGAWRERSPGGCKTLVLSMKVHATYHPTAGGGVECPHSFPCVVLGD